MGKLDLKNREFRIEYFDPEWFPHFMAGMKLKYFELKNISNNRVIPFNLQGINEITFFDPKTGQEILKGVHQ